MTERSTQELVNAAIEDEVMVEDTALLNALLRYRKATLDVWAGPWDSLKMRVRHADIRRWAEVCWDHEDEVIASIDAEKGVVHLWSRRGNGP